MERKEPQPSKDCKMFWNDYDLVWEKLEAGDIKETKYIVQICSYSAG